MQPGCHARRGERQLGAWSSLEHLLETINFDYTLLNDNAIRVIVLSVFRFARSSRAVSVTPAVLLQRLQTGGERGFTIPVS